MNIATNTETVHTNEDAVLAALAIKTNQELAPGTIFLRQFHSIVRLYEFEKVDEKGWVIANDMLKNKRVNSGRVDSEAFIEKIIITDLMRNQIGYILRESRQIHNRDQSVLTMSGINAIMSILEITDGEFEVINKIAFELAWHSNFGN